MQNIVMGANILDIEKSKVEFRVFAYNKKKVSLLIKSGNIEKIIPMEEKQKHLYSTVVENMGLDLLYKFRIDNEGDYPDPYSNFQPFGVHGFSKLINHKSYVWNDENWKGVNLDKLIIYELHVGTFTSEGTFKATIKQIDYLQRLGVTAIELMPVIQTPGRWNWGYDGANLFSVNHNYGTPDDLKDLVNSCHQQGVSVILDVVYNHFGPEGNYLPLFGPYLTDKYKTPWGSAVNFDDKYCEYARKMVLDNVQYWMEMYHLDGLRLDAVHAIIDNSKNHILKEISIRAKELAFKHDKNFYVIAETDENDTKLINSFKKDGYGIDAQWMDDFHHCIHTILTGEKNGYYVDYGQIEDMEKVFQDFLFTGQYSRFWKKERGTIAFQNPGNQFVVSIQNHDQVGNRAQGERLTTLIKFPYLKTAAGLMFFSAYIPLLFMGEEYGEERPFLFFTDFLDLKLKKSVLIGRRKEFKNFNWDEIPDPENDQIFYDSKLTPRNSWTEKNYWIFNFYRDLIQLRQTHSVLQSLNKKNLRVNVDKNNYIVKVVRWNHQKKLIGLFNLGKNTLDLANHRGSLIINSSWKQYGGNEKKESRVLNKGSMVILELI